MKFWVDFLLFFFSLCNAGITIHGTPSAMTTLVLFSLILGKTVGVMLMDWLSRKVLGFHAPLGIRRRHMFMIGLMASMSMCIGLFVADGAQWNIGYKGTKSIYLKEDCKLGILLSMFVSIPAYFFSIIFHLKDEDVIDEAHKQIDEELAEALKHHTHKMGGLFSGHIKLPSLPTFGSKAKAGQEESKEDAERDGASSIELKSDPEVTKEVAVVESSKEDGTEPQSEKI